MTKDHEQIAQRVLTKQQRYKTYHDRKPGVKSIDVKIGDHVRVKNPRHVGKGQLKFSQPMEVVKVNGTCVTLKGGRKWNMSRIVKCTTTAFNHVPHPQHNNNDSYTWIFHVTTSNRHYLNRVLTLPFLTVRYMK